MSDGNTQDAAAGGEAQPQNDQQTWEQECEQVKTNYFIIRNAIDHREEPLSVMKDMASFLNKIVTNPALLDQNKEFKDFFYQDCALGLLKRLNKERSADPEVSNPHSSVFNLSCIVS